MDFSTQEHPMRRRLPGWLAMCVLVIVLASMAARADDDKEEKVPLDKVPKAVLKAVKAKFRGAELISAQTEKEDGKTLYEINLKDKGHTVDVSLTPDGKIVSIEKTIDAKDLPRRVTETINNKYPKADYKRVEEITEGGKTSYEVLLVAANKKKIEMVLDRDGKIIKEEAKDKKD
jgi:uncharacterized membrane protein YkoI